MQQIQVDKDNYNCLDNMCHIHLHSLCPFNGGVPALTAAVQYKKNCKQVFNKLMWAKK